MDNSQECCPQFDTSLYDGKEIAWKDKPFIKDYVAQVFHMPLNFGSVVTRMFKKVEGVGASVDPKEFLMLAHDPSQWKSEIYMTTSKEVEGAENVKLSGKFLTKVFDGPYSDMYKFYTEMDKYVKEKGYTPLKQYFYYPYCPKCAKKFGHNYIVAFTQVS